MDDANDLDLAVWLLRQAADQRLSAYELRLCLDTFFPEGEHAPSLSSLLARLESETGGAAQVLRQRLQTLRLERALAWHTAARFGLPPTRADYPELADMPADIGTGWELPEGIQGVLALVFAALSDQVWQRRHEPELAWLAALLDARLAAAQRALAAYSERWGWLTLAPPSEVADAVRARQHAVEATASQAEAGPISPERLRALEWRLSETDLDDAERRACEDALLAWPSPLAAAPLARIAQTDAVQARVTVALAMRLGAPTQMAWSMSRAVLELHWQRVETLREALRPICERRQAELCWLYLHEDDAPNTDAVAALEAMIAAQQGPAFRRDLADRLGEDITNAQEHELTGRAPAAAAVPSLAAPVAAMEWVAEDEAPELRPAEAYGEFDVRPAAPAEPAPPAEPPAPPEPSVWHDHLQPFLLANWYMVAGLLMVVVGAALLAYFSWDNMLLRFTIMPSFLVLFTFALAGMGRWMERHDEALRPTAAMLRGGAICLIPVNMMTLPLLAGEPTMAADVKMLALGGGAVVYLLLFGWGSWRWSRAVHLCLGATLGPSLMILNALLLLAAVVRIQEPPNLAVMVGGFYVAGAAAIGLAVVFLRRLDLATSQIQRVPWFYGIVLALTLVEVFALTHWAIGVAPTASHYGALVILLGGLILESERRALQLRAQPDGLGGESFLGFAAIIFGVLLTLPQPQLRIVGLLLAGVVWLKQAGTRRGVLHHWLGLSMAVAGLATIGMLPQFPRSQALDLVGVLGLAIALVLGSVRVVSRRSADPRLSATASELQPLILLLAGIAAVISQWHLVSDPRVTAGVLLVVAAGLAWRAHRQQRLAWVHAAVAAVVLALPYLGCVDMVGRTLVGNTLAFGLAVVATLWIAFVGVVRRPLLIAARSTVIWGLGTLAVGAMIIRIVAEMTPAGSPLGWRLLDQGGPLLMAICLAIGAYLSRSLVPGVLAAVILAVLFPELKSQYKDAFEALGWGTGIGSASAALGLVGLCFGLRRWLPATMPGGDKFMGVHTFPLRREDHSLFTWPLLGTSLYLALKFTAWLAPSLYMTGLLRERTAWALLVAAVAWTLMAIYLRRQPGAMVLAMIGWVPLIAGATILCRLLPAAPPPAQYRILAPWLLLQVVYLGYRLAHGRWPWLRSLLARPLADLLFGSSIVLTVLLTAGFVRGVVGRDVCVLAPLLVLHLGWQEYHRRDWWAGLFGAVFCLLTVAMLALWQVPLARFSHDEDATRRAIGALLGFGLVVQIAAGTVSALHRRGVVVVRSLAMNYQLVGQVVAYGAAILLTADILDHFQRATVFGPGYWVALVVLLIVTARAEHAATLVLLLIGFLYVWATHSLGADGYAIVRPINVGALALTIAVAAMLGKPLAAHYPRLLLGRLPMVRAALPRRWALLVPAELLAVFACLAAIVFVLLAPDQEYSQAAGAALAALVWLLAAFAGVFPMHIVFAILAMCLANLLAATGFYLAYDLQAYGLTPLHVIAAGLVSTALQSWIARLAVTWILGTDEPEVDDERDDVDAPEWVNRGLIRDLIRRCADNVRLRQWGLLLTADILLAFSSGTTLLVLSMNYLVQADVEALTGWRLLASGAMASLAAICLRFAARRAERAGNALGSWLDGGYHFGLTLAVWCVVLLIPAMRAPALALPGLALAPLLFFLRAIWHGSRGPDDALQTLRNRNSATVLAAALLVLYICRGAVDMIAYPSLRQDIQLYHQNALVAVGLGLLLLRLHAMGGAWWQAFYGGLAVIVGTYFTVTWIPGLSIAEHRQAGAWAALAVAHLFIALSHQRSPLRTAIARLGGLTSEHWLDLRRDWGHALELGTQAAVLVGVIYYREDPRQVALLIAGAASVALHHGLAGRRPLYLALAGVELLLALHADFVPAFQPSYLHRDWVIWVFPAVWLVLLAVQPVLRRWLGAHLVSRIAAGLAAFTLAHVLWHHPESPVGLAAVAVIFVLTLITPVASGIAMGPLTSTGARLPLLAPLWLAYFACTDTQHGDWMSLIGTRPLLALAIAAWLTGMLARELARRSPLPHYEAMIGYRLLHRTWRQLVIHGWPTHLSGQTLATAAAAVLVVTRLDMAHDSRTFTVLLGLWVALGFTWYQAARRVDTMVLHMVWQLCAYAGFLVIRQQLLLTTAHWRLEYDVWTSLAISFLITGIKPLLHRQPRELARSLILTMLVLPVVAVVWIIWKQLGTDLALVVLGTYGLMFSFMGGRRRESPFHALAVGMFLSFILLLFWQRLELRVVQAYIIPVGLSTLVLLQLFGRQLQPPLRNGIRMVAVLAMIGSAGFYAVADESHPIWFNLTMLLLCLAAMGLGGFLRVRVYVVLGFAGLVIDIASVVYKVVSRLDHTLRMAGIGVLLLLLGVLLVGGTAWYKTHRDAIDDRIDRLRRRFDAWE